MHPFTLCFNFQFVLESARFCCDIDICGMWFGNSTDFERHISENHGHEEHFSCQHCTFIVKKQSRHFGIDIPKHDDSHSN